MICTRYVYSTTATEMAAACCTGHTAHNTLLKCGHGVMHPVWRTGGRAPVLPVGSAPSTCWLPGGFLLLRAGSLVACGGLCRRPNDTDAGAIRAVG